MHISVDINIDYLWGDKHFVKNDWGDITYIVGANGTGKTQFAQPLKKCFQDAHLKVRYLGAERISVLNKMDTTGYFSSDKLQNGLNISSFEQYKSVGAEMGYALDALVRLKTKLDLRIKIEALLSEAFNRQISFSEAGGYLKTIMNTIDNGKNYDLKLNECHGLKELISLLTFIYDDEYNCLILDEPEMHLHPQYQQFILQEMRKVAGDPFQYPDKKMFVILTHSPTMLDIRTIDNLKNYIVFTPSQLPSYIENWGAEDTYDIEQLSRLLPRLNSNHKSLFFARTPIFVEGYTDQQIFNLIQEIRDVNLGANGISIVDVGGKDEVNMMYRLCKRFNMDAKAVLDSDCLFDGKMRQTISNLPTTTEFLASHGLDNLMKEIGQLETKLGDLINIIEQIPETNFATDSELKDFHNALRLQTDQNSPKMKKRLTYIAVNRQCAELKAVLGKCHETLINSIIGKSQKVLLAFENAGIFILPKGELENYYKTFLSNHYSIDDGQKTNLFIKERDHILQHKSKSIVDSDYADIVQQLDKICVTGCIDLSKYLSANIGDWLHLVQRSIKISGKTEIDALKTNPTVKWELYERLFDIISCEPDEINGFKCVIKLKKCVDPTEKELSFDSNTVAANFKV